MILLSLLLLAPLYWVDSKPSLNYVFFTCLYLFIYTLYTEVKITTEFSTKGVRFDKSVETISKCISNYYHATFMQVLPERSQTLRQLLIKLLMIFINLKSNDFIGQFATNMVK